MKRRILILRIKQIAKRIKSFKVKQNDQDFLKVLNEVTLKVGKTTASKQRF